MHLSTPEPSASSSTSSPESRASASPPDVVDVGHSASTCTLSLDVLSSPSLTQVLPTGLPSTSDYPVTGTDPAYSPESHPSMPAPGDPDPSLPWTSSAPDLGTASEGEGSAKAALR